MRPAAPVISTFMREWLTADGPAGVDGAEAGVRGGLEPARGYGLRPLKRGFDGRAVRADPVAVSAAVASAFSPLQSRLHARVFGGPCVHRRRGFASVSRVAPMRSVMMQNVQGAAPVQWPDPTALTPVAPTPAAAPA